jgi:polysaccharide pyruvyl transferase CsaB
MYRIGISGSYGGTNLGDEAILSSIIADIRSTVSAEITVFTENSDDTVLRHHVERAVRCLEMSRDQLLAYIDGLDLFILGGGGILFDHWVLNHMREALLAEERGVPVMVYAVGVGPLEDREAQRLVRECLSRAAVVTVRDPGSRIALEMVGVQREILVTADPALLLSADPLPERALEREGIAEDARLIGMSVREPGPAAPDLDVEAYHAQLANAADYVVERYDAQILMVPLEPSVRDLQHSHAVVARMNRPQSAHVLKQEYTPQQLIALAQRFSFSMGMRLHFLIFSALAHVPFVALPYAAKITGFIDRLGLCAPPMKDLTVGQLIAFIDRRWDERDELRKQLDRELPSVQEAARRNWRLALELLESRRPAGEPVVSAPRSEG